MTVKNTDIPPPILLNSSDSLIDSGNYNINYMIADDSDLPEFIMQFTEDNRVLLDSTNTGNYVDNGSTYFVFININIRLKPNGVDKLICNYYYNPDDQL
ncbi:MAG: hypothetical protein WBN27_08235 [Eudoraea sp.]|uniref:hypothetical protein n=1 Tax=Eudoraea sp. TaxID=1979955 RepID=UPI003C765C56